MPPKAKTAVPVAMDVIAERQAREASLAKEHTSYLEDHPEVKGLLSDFITAALIEQPEDVFAFAREHFALRKKERGEGRSSLKARLKEVFDATDKDCSGTISRTELRQKLMSDDEVQRLMTEVGGEGSHSVMEQLDQDGDGEITWLEFESFFDAGW